MYQRELKLQKGVKNTIQIQFKNSDQKLLNVSSSTFVAVLYDATNQRNLIEKTITILDDGVTTSLRGLGKLEFTESDLEACESDYYSIGFKTLDVDGSYVAAYANTYYGVAGTVKVQHDLYATLLPSQEITSFDVFYNADQGARRYEYYSGNLNASPQFKSNTALHTVAVYMTNYRGRVLIEGTLENDPTTFGNYAVISDKTYTVFSGIDYTNFNGIFSKIRIRYIPEKNPVTQRNNDTTYAGTVDRVLYRS